MCYAALAVKAIVWEAGRKDQSVYMDSDGRTGRTLPQVAITTPRQ